MISEVGNNAVLHASAFAECEALVRDADPDRFVSLQFAPADKRGPLAALYAFNIETARVREVVSQPLPGEIRLQWWRDLILADPVDAEGGQGSPIATALLHTIHEYELPRDAFDRFIDARIFDLYDDPMPSREAFETYAGETASALIVLAAMVLDRSATPNFTDAGGHAGVAQAAVGALRSAQRHRARHQVYIPSDILAATGLDAAGWLANDPKARVADEAFRAFAQDHLARAADSLPRMPTSLRPAFLPAFASKLYLRRSAISDEGWINPFQRLWLYWRLMRR